MCVSEIDFWWLFAGFVTVAVIWLELMLAF